MAIGNLKIEQYVPAVKLNEGLYTELPIETTNNLIVAGTAAITGAITGPAAVAAQATATVTLTAAQSGTVFFNTQGAATTTFTLPSAVAGLTYGFIETNAGGEILITPATGDAIVTKIHSAENGTALAPAAGTGIKNTAATNVAGDGIFLVALDTTTWYGYSITGLWASQ